jgi:hypothetical protein
VVTLAVTKNGENMTSEKVREIKLRRWASRLGLVLHKSRARKWSIDNYQKYMIVNPYTNIIVAGQRYDLTLDAVEAFLQDDEKEKKAASK